MASSRKNKASGQEAAVPVPVQSTDTTGVTGVTDDRTLLEYVKSGDLSVPTGHKAQKAFFRFVRKAGKDKKLNESIQRIRDAVIRESLARPDQDKGLVIGLFGPQGGEGSSVLSLMLALSLGSCTQRRVGVLDGKLSPQRFSSLSDALSLSKNCVCLETGGSEILGYYNESAPNVHFLKSSTDEESLRFFSDKRLGAFLDEIRRTFDFTIIDMPPILRDTTSVFLAPAVDRLYLVAKADSTSLGDIQKCDKFIKQTGGSISGVLLNQQKTPLWSRFFWREFFV